MKKMSIYKKVFPLVMVGLLLSAFVVALSFAPASTPLPFELFDEVRRIGEVMDEIESYVDTIDDNLNSLENKIWSDVDSLKNETKALEAKLDYINGYLEFELRALEIEYGDLILDDLQVIQDELDAFRLAIGNELDAKLDVLLEDHTRMLDTAQIMLDGVNSTIRFDHDLIMDDLQTILSELNNIDDAVTDVKEELESWFGPMGEYSKTAQFTSHGGKSVFAPIPTTTDPIPVDHYVVIYEDGTIPREVATVTVTFKTEGIGAYERLYVRYYVDPVNPDDFMEKEVCRGQGTSGWTDTAAAWKVEIHYLVREGTDTVWWACSAIHPPEW